MVVISRTHFVTIMFEFPLCIPVIKNLEHSTEIVWSESNCIQVRKRMNIDPSSWISYWTVSLHDFSTWHTCSHHFVVFADLVSHSVLHLESCEMAEDLNFHKKRRVTRSSLTKLSTKVTELEAYRSSPDAFYNARNVASKLKTLDTEFRNH